MLGLGCGLLARHPSPARGVVCALAALGLGLYTEWRHFPFMVDGSLGHFLTHLSQLKPVTLLMIGAGGALAYWFGKDAGYGRPT